MPMPMTAFATALNEQGGHNVKSPMGEIGLLMFQVVEGTTYSSTTLRNSTQSLELKRKK